eukprot:TRINITY_DN114850_c0_g1_i1.p1 TRINITY_DN114850_c0_g1~~TRINITY_DN114850_c0_g1_i1.p1  ORF type:complete len:109 (-),score=23.53 TRINITY_DN114850_c0_g1_i1:89-415(-)
MAMTVALSKFGPLTRWFTTCGSTKECKPNQAAVQPAKNSESKKKQSDVRNQVHVDTTTTVPAELYWDLLSAGERAKLRGQHELKVPSRRNRAFSPRRPHLVIAAAGGA